MAEISIIDTGCGIPEQDLQRIFDSVLHHERGWQGYRAGTVHQLWNRHGHGGTIDVEST